MRGRKPEKEEGVYRPVPGYQGLYEIDTFGNIIRNFKTKSVALVPSKKNGLMVVRLMTPAGNRKEERIHKLVQLTFLGPAPPGKVLYHKNGDKLDNCVNNLGFIDRQTLGKMTGHRSRQKAVLQIDRDGNIVKIYRSARAAGLENYMSYQTIMDRCNGRTKGEYAPDGYKYIWDDDYEYGEEIG